MSSFSFLAYNLPDERIAQRPIGQGSDRSNSKLLQAIKLPDTSVAISDQYYFDLPDLLRVGDLLVLNNSKVRPCRFFVRLENVQKEIEILLIKKVETLAASSQNISQVWEALARPMKRLKIGQAFELSPSLQALPIGRSQDNNRLLLEISITGANVAQAIPPMCETVEEVLLREARMPIPPYIRGGRADSQDRDTYQNVYAETSGSIAAPTAGFHFSAELLKKLSERGIEHTYLTLHVSTASFTPIRKSDIAGHKMSEEYYEISRSTLEKICLAKKEQRRIIVVGTTCLRALESAALNAVFCKDLGQNEKITDSTSLFITPGFKFQVADCLITNFHQPNSTHLLVVASFIGEKNTQTIYKHALNEGNYRFLSYGDGMLLE
ncbi:MAG: tRNA preQ1(34) S-adenosylmethionine ribosyltransferase-isomerase QueA [Deltaproteobacteria bacterium]|jgi:S-adenosylmethionine:tRNA ribosyltransferase-isomerase|nr:tRNA preQ1(34) S-adenosylmethionine ribosyltransferase-isomerase QueA [Deltaproteobacteria bacterium]